MKQFYIAGFAVMLLAGCAPQAVDTMPTTIAQSQDLSDADYDGVISAREQCEQTLNGALVDNNGCPEQLQTSESFELNVHFDTDSADVDVSQYTDIQTLADFMQRYPNTQVVIEGHASKAGSAEYNLALSQRRAQAIADVLTRQFAIPAARIEAIGYGESRPLIDQENDYANEVNRRVIAHVTGEHGSTHMRWTIYSSEQTP